MKRVVKQLVITLSLSTLAACAGTSEPADGAAEEGKSGDRDCIRQPSIRGYTVLDEQNLIVEEAGRRQYLVVLQRRAYGLRNTMGIAFNSPSSRICSSFSEVIFTDNFGDKTEVVRIRHIRLLSPEEEEDLLIKFGKKEPEIKQTPTPQDVKGADVEELDPAASE